MEVEINGVYKHYSGDLYIVLDVAYDCEKKDANGDPLKLVIYRALYEGHSLWVREYDDFIQEVNKNGQKYRFELQKIERKNQRYSSK